MPNIGHPDRRHPDYQPDYTAEQREMEERMLDDALRQDRIYYELYEAEDYSLTDIGDAMDVVATARMKLPRSGVGEPELMAVARRLFERHKTKVDHILNR